MIIELKKIPDGISEIVFDHKVEEIASEADVKGDVKVLAKVDKSEDQIIVNCKLDCKLEFECDRCCKEYLGKLSFQFNLYFLVGQENEDTEDDNTRYITFDTEKLDISNDVRDYLVTNMPLKRICKKGCKGLCSKCGNDLNEKECGCVIETNNPIWDKLKDINL